MAVADFPRQDQPAQPWEGAGRLGQVWTLADVEDAVRAGWGADTCDPADLADWSMENPARGQCGVTALVLHDLFGGELVLGTVLVGGKRTGVHYWNRFGAEVVVDLTRNQFRADETVEDGQVLSRPDGPPRRCREQYELLRSRVLARLGGVTTDQ